MKLRLISSLFIILLCCCALTAWIVGLFAFAEKVANYNKPGISPLEIQADGIVVLTGGSERLATGLELLVSGKGRKLLVSGVHPGLTIDKVIAHRAVTKDLRDCCIALGHAAGNTEGNAVETRIWMETEKFHSLILVTAAYHMPRSLLAFRQELPNAEIIPYPVAPENVKMDNWWLYPGTANLLITEYCKYLIALAFEAIKGIS